MKEKSVTIRSGPAGRWLVSDILPVLIEANDDLHASLGKNLIAAYVAADGEVNFQKYVRDFRTIRLHLGQRMGHTTAIGRHAKPGDLVVDITHQYALETCSITVPGVECIGRQSLLEKGRKFYRPYPTIWLSNFNLWPRTSMNEVRERLIKNTDQRMIILG